MSGKGEQLVVTIRGGKKPVSAENVTARVWMKASGKGWEGTLVTALDVSIVPGEMYQMTTQDNRSGRIIVDYANPKPETQTLEVIFTGDGPPL